MKLINFFQKLFPSKDNLELEVDPDVLIKEIETKRGKHKVIAAVTLFIDMASVDSDFSYDEYEYIMDKIVTNFNLSKNEANKLVHKAEEVVKYTKVVDRYAKLLRDEASVEERITILNIIDNIITSDKNVSEFEKRLSCKFEKSLSIKVTPNF